MTSTKPDPTFPEVNEDIARTITETGPAYWWTLGITVVITAVCFFGPWFYQIKMGLQMAANNHPVVWSSYLGCFIFWIGLSHSGTLLSAVLHITKSSWRKAIYRSAEAMTLFSLVTAAMFVMVHVGRVWFVHWTTPYPNQMGLWPNFRSPLFFDVMAITTYLTASWVFIYMGSIPDFAAMRDRTTGWRNKFFTIWAMGWRGTHKEWHHLGQAYTFFAVFVIPLAVSVHSIVSWDFAMSITPGLHETIFAPYFVCGAIYSGTAGIVTLMWVLRRSFVNYDRYIKPMHFDNLGRLLLVLSLIWTYINIVEVFTHWYSGSSMQIEHLKFKILGFYAPVYWEMILFCAVAPLLLISRKFRRNLTCMLVLSILINIGMFSERFLIVAASQPRQYLPDAWGFYFPSLTEIMIAVGSFGIFVTLFLIFVKFVPSISLYEVKETLPEPGTEAA
jgi:Ni/Fe-hydrogenase subunit HybB-like protein